MHREFDDRTWLGKAHSIPRAIRGDSDSPIIFCTANDLEPHALPRSSFCRRIAAPTLPRKIVEMDIVYDDRLSMLSFGGLNRIPVRSVLGNLSCLGSAAWWDMLAK
jgi:hypothetical protein